MELNLIKGLEQSHQEVLAKCSRNFYDSSSLLSTWTGIFIKILIFTEILLQSIWKAKLSFRGLRPLNVAVAKEL